MSNIWSLFENYEKKYHSWLQDKNVKSWYHPNQIVKSYQGSRIDQGLLGVKDTLWGKAGGDVAGQPPIHQSQGTQGWFGHGDSTANMAGFNKEAWKNIQSGSAAENAKLLYAGGMGPVKDYALGKEKLVSSPTIGETERSGFKESQMGKDIHKGLDTGMESLYETMKWSVNKTDEVVKESLNVLFPNLDVDITKDEKKNLADMVKSGKVDHGFIKHLKNKNSPVKESDVSALEKFIGVSKETAMKNWKDKNGFEGLMSNPAFTLGLALMQSSAEGKSIGSGILDNFVTAAGISEHYKDRIKARTNVMGPITKEERALVDSAMASIGIDGPGFWKGKIWDNVKLWGKDHEAMYNEGLNKIAAKAKKMINKKYEGKDHQITKDDYIWAMNQLKNSGELNETQNWFSSGLDASGKERQRTSAFHDWLIKKAPWLKDNFMFPARAEGGPVQAGQPYVVGEKGPEIVVPNQNATVLSNDDSQVMSMLLASNPQLQNVSRARAEGILRSRFPDYFA